MSLQTDTAQQQAWWRRRLLHDWLGSQAQLPIERNPRRAVYEYARRLAVLGAVVTVNVVIAGLAVLTFLDSAGPPPMAAVEVAAAISAVLLLSGLLTPLARARAIRAGLPSRDMRWSLSGSPSMLSPRGPCDSTQVPWCCSEPSWLRSCCARSHRCSIRPRVCRAPPATHWHEPRRQSPRTPPVSRVLRRCSRLERSSRFWRTPSCSGRSTGVR